MKRSAVHGRIAWLDFLIGSVCMCGAMLILQLFSRAKKDRYASEQQLRPIGALLLGAVGFLLHSEPRTSRNVQKRE